MKTPAALMPAKTLLEVAQDQGTVAASLQAALGAAPGAGGAADQAMSVSRQALAVAVVDAVMIASAKLDQVIRRATSQIVSEWVEEEIEKEKERKKKKKEKFKVDWEPPLPDQAKYALDNAANQAGIDDNRFEARDAIPDGFAQRIYDAAQACDNSHLPASLAVIKEDIALAVVRAALEMISNRKGVQSQPPIVCHAAVKEMATLRDDLKATIGAAAGLAPFIPIDPKANAPLQLVNNENAKIVARVAAVAAAEGVARGSTPEDSAQAGAAA
ncbi:hypothetical protein ACLESO_58620, partial [Pyxidicoccus sp. 3LG]